jgi:dipeptide/tripeptide permease
MIVFALLFVGMIVGFFVYIWMKERNEKEEGDPS